MTARQISHFTETADRRPRLPLPVSAEPRRSAPAFEGRAHRAWNQARAGVPSQSPCRLRLTPERANGADMDAFQGLDVFCVEFLSSAFPDHRPWASFGLAQDQIAPAQGLRRPRGRPYK